MSLGWGDLRRTVRRSGEGPAQAYPFLLRDERLHPRIGLAVEYFESMVGRPRAEMDGEVLVQFFADHRLARGVVAALSVHYAYRRQGFADTLDAETRARLAAAGLQAPADLRAALYADVNAHSHGFAADAARQAALERLATRLDLAAQVVESLLVLDADDRAPLARLSAAPPSASEVAANYNHLVANAVLRAAARIDLELGTRSAAFERSLELRAGALGVRVERGHHLTLLGEQDAVGSWSRQGRRLARALATALVRHPGAIRGGLAHVDWRGAEYVCRLEHDHLAALVGPGRGLREAGHPPLETTAEVYWDPRPELAALRRRGGAKGWTIGHWPSPLVYPEGVLFPELVLQHGELRVLVVLVDGPALVESVERLAPRLAARSDVLLVGTPSTLPALAAVPVPHVPLDDAAPLAAVLAAAAELPSPAGGARRVALQRLVERVQVAGFLPLDEALAVAGCAHEAELAARLADPAAGELRLVPGVGLHTEAFFGRLQAARA